MNKRENLISLYRRKGYQKAPVSFSLCPSQMKKFHEIYGADANVADVFGFSMREIGDGVLRAASLADWLTPPAALARRQ